MKYVTTLFVGQQIIGATFHKTFYFYLFDAFVNLMSISMRREQRVWLGYKAQVATINQQLIWYLFTVTNDFAQNC